MGFGVWGLGFGVWGLGFGVWGLRLLSPIVENQTEKTMGNGTLTGVVRGFAFRLAGLGLQGVWFGVGFFLPKQAMLARFHRHPLAISVTLFPLFSFKKETPN